MYGGVPTLHSQRNVLSRGPDIRRSIDPIPHGTAQYRLIMALDDINTILLLVLHSTVLVGRHGYARVVKNPAVLSVGVVAVRKHRLVWHH